jgi:hypothetical protein
MAEFEIEADSETIKINGFELAPAEGAALAEAVSFAGAMRDIPRLPPKIDFPPFRVSFFEDGTLTVKRVNGAGGEVKFAFSTVDQLLVAVNQATEISRDRKRLAPSPRVTSGNLYADEGEIIEGR